MSLLRIAAIDFLNPAPLMWGFEQEPERLRGRYSVRTMSPAACAAALRAGEADLGLVPAGAYAADDSLSILPGSAIASLGAIRSILLVVRARRAGAEARRGAEPDPEPPTPEEVGAIRSVALDGASRTSALYTQVLLRKYWGAAEGVSYRTMPAELDRMLAETDAALLIGDPALAALERAAEREARTGERLLYLDLGALWRRATGTAWVSAFWAVRTECLEALDRGALLDDFNWSREAGLRHVAEIVKQWAPRLGLPAATVETYLTRNIHYRLDAPCLEGLNRFWGDAAELGLLAAKPTLRMVERV